MRRLKAIGVAVLIAGIASELILSARIGLVAIVSSSVAMVIAIAIGLIWSKGYR
jgi:hypothetical protein